MRKLLLFTICATGLNYAFAQSQAKLFADGRETSEIVLNTETYKVEFPVDEDAVSKTLNTPLMTRLDYTLYIGDGDESVGLDNIYHTGDHFDGAKNWKKFAKQDGVITREIDGGDINHALYLLERHDWPNQDYKFKIWIEATPGLGGERIIVSEKWVTIPKSLKAPYFAKEDQETLESFQRGAYSNKINEPALSDAIERYMENKWPAEDITTVNVQNLTYTNTSATSFKFEGTYISQKDGGCKYNTCYGKGVVSGGKFSISFFNSMSAEKSMSCSMASQLKNR